MEKLIDMDKSVIVACDVKLGQLKAIVEATRNIDRISGYKLGISTMKQLDRACETIREITPHKVIIYDHQKGACDIPDTGEEYADVIGSANVDGGILFPFGGKLTHEEWVKHLRKRSIVPIVGGWMTHKGFLAEEGGYVTKLGVLKIYRDAANLGVRHFVVPGNKPEAMREILGTLETVGITTENAIFYSPGLISQGGEIADVTKMFKKGWHAIVGRGIYQREDLRAAAEKVTSEL